MSGGDPRLKATRLDPRLKVARLAAVAGGCAAIFAAMLLVPEHSRWRDLAWTAGVALLVLAIVANRLVGRGGRKEAGGSAAPPGERATPADGCDRWGC